MTLPLRPELDIFASETAAKAHTVLDYALHRILLELRKASFLYIVVCIVIVYEGGILMHTGHALQSRLITAILIIKKAEIITRFIMLCLILLRT